MMRKLLLAAALLVCCKFAAGQGCLESANVKEPFIPEAAKKLYEEKLSEAKLQYERAPDSPDSFIWLGRRTAYLGNYKQAIGIFSSGIDKFSSDARLLRHRAHRLLTIRCFADAIKDFEKAAKLAKGKPDEIEPDGLPNERNIPTSTLKSNIYYHLGLAYYLQGKFQKALKAYKECEKFSANPDMLVATKHWQYMAFRRMGKEKAAQKAVAGIADGLDIIENDDYYKLIKLYQGKLKAADLFAEIGGNTDTLGNASLGYGLGNWHLYNGEKEKAEGIFRQVLAGKQWASFGFIAAEAELNKKGR